MVTGLSNSFFANKALPSVATRRISKMILGRGNMSWLHQDYVSFTNEQLIIIIVIIVIIMDIIIIIIIICHQKSYYLLAL